MDGGSNDGSAEWLTNNPEVIAVSEKDKGMYNALNKAINKAKGNIIGHLNCDEQYLPGVLKFIKNYFDENPSIDFVAMDFLVITPKGNLVAYRKSFQPKWFYFFSNYLYTNTCSLFYRREIFDAYKFDESYRSIADVILVYNVIKSGYKGKHVSKFSAVFTYSGDNLSLNQISQVEKKKFNNTLPIWYKILKPVFFVMFFVEKFFNRT